MKISKTNHRNPRFKIAKRHQLEKHQMRDFQLQIKKGLKNRILSLLEHALLINQNHTKMKEKKLLKS